MPKEHGIPFSPEMIRVLLEHRKSMTRRTGKELKEINQHPDDWELLNSGPEAVAANIWIFQRRDTYARVYIECPYTIHDTVYCKEPHAFEKRLDHRTASEIGNAGTVGIWYKVNDTQKDRPNQIQGRWRSAMFMPKRFARIRGTITAIGCERVQDISREDCLAEGIVGTREWCELDYKAPEPLHPEDKSNEEADREIERGWGAYTRQSFAALWDNLNGKTHPWGSNVWVWKLKILEITP